MIDEISENEITEIDDGSGEVIEDVNAAEVMDSVETEDLSELQFDDEPEIESEINEVSEQPEAVSEEIEADETYAEAETSETGLKEYLDDNGEVYREGDSLIPNSQFEIRGYQYETDDQGRICSAEGDLQIGDAEYGRNMENVRDIEGQEYLDTDHRGHLIAHMFSGSDRLENLVPMDARLNQGDYLRLEHTLYDALKDGAEVRLKVEPVYEDDSTRPSEFRVSYSIDGDREEVVFRNEREGQL